jgi:hypothetical protein
MKQVVIENPVINSPFDEPQRHFRFKSRPQVCLLGPRIIWAGREGRPLKRESNAEDTHIPIISAIYPSSLIS